jgi:hypothetical protein
VTNSSRQTRISGRTWKGKKLPEETKIKPAQVSSVEVRNAQRDMLDMLRSVAETQKAAGRGMNSVIEDIMQSDDPLAQGETTKVADIIGLPIHINEFWPNIGEYGVDGNDPYAVIDALDKSTGEKLLITCGGNVVLAQLLKMFQLKKFPFDAKFIENETKGEWGTGKVYRLVRV